MTQNLIYDIDSRNNIYENLLHEINTPVSVIHSVLQIMETEKNMYEGFYKNLSIAKRNCLNIIKIVNDFKIYKNISVGNIYPIFKKYDIVFLLKDIVDSASRLAARKNISVAFQHSLGNRDIVLDKEMFQRIILNLISNSIKFTDMGGLISIYLEKNMGNILIHVKDNGSGINENEVNSIFERYTTNNSYTNKHGTGIGLAIVKSLVTLHKGVIFAGNRTDCSGAAFTVILPDNLPETVYSDDVCFEDIYSENIVQIELSDII